MSLETPEKIRSLQRKLYCKAKAEPGFRFYVLYDKICREDVLLHAYALTRDNAGAPGVDGTEAAMLGGLLGSSPLEPCQHKPRAGQVQPSPPEPASSWRCAVIYCYAGIKPLRANSLTSVPITPQQGCHTACRRSSGRNEWRRSSLHVSGSLIWTMFGLPRGHLRFPQMKGSGGNPLPAMTNGAAGLCTNSWALSQARTTPLCEDNHVAVCRLRAWHEAQASKSLVQARRSRFPKNFEREAELHRKSAELIVTLSPEDV